MNEISHQSGPAPERTLLYDLHLALGARMTPFAGYQLPIQYQDGIIAEHLATRAGAGLFDVSHMGQVAIEGAGACEKFSRLVPIDCCALAAGRTRYTQFLNAQAGVLDDLMVTRPDESPDRLFVVCNGAVKRHDLALMTAALPDLDVKMLDDRALLALQGPLAVAALRAMTPGVENLQFMSMGRFDFDGAALMIWRSGYTGEDGFEISLPAGAAVDFAKRLLAHGEVKPVGLGARDSLRLEAGLCLYGHDLTETINPAEADLLWSIPKARRENGDFIGAKALRKIIAQGPQRKRIGFLLEGRAIAREGAEIAGADGRKIGAVTSGAFSPTLNRPIAMGYIETQCAAPGVKVEIAIRGKPAPAQTVALPFTPQRYFRG